MNNKNEGWANFGKLVIALIFFLSFIFIIVWATASGDYKTAVNNCSRVSVVSKYPVQFEGNFWGNSHCWIEVAPGVWADNNYIKYDKVQ